MDKLIEIVKEEASILVYPIMMMLEKGIEFQGETIRYHQDEEVAIAVLQILAALKASTNSILLLASQDAEAMMSKDSLPIARSIVEGCINATFIMALGKDVAKSALEHTVVKGFKNTDRTAGKGSHKMSLQRIPRIQPDESLSELIDKFTSKKGRAKNWTDLSVPQRIEKIEPIFGRKCAAGLTTAYLMIYSDASEIVHGSVAGAKIANGTIAFGKYPRSDQDHIKVQQSHIEGSLLSSFISMHSVLSAYCKYTEFSALDERVKEQFSKFEDFIKNDYQ